jgi:hypothetical protein
VTPLSATSVPENVLSPLTIQSSDGPAPSEEDVIGVTSVIVCVSIFSKSDMVPNSLSFSLLPNHSWLFTIVVIFKYAMIVLQFGTGLGEGGTFALYQGLFPKSMNEDDIRADTTYGVASAGTRSIGGLASPRKEDRRVSLLRHAWFKPVLCGWALFGSGLTVSAVR